MRHRFHVLDAMRGLAALLVVLVHAPAYIQERFHPQNNFLAVDFFFCLSGFVIAHSYRQRLEGGMTLPNFLRARLIRLFPVYLLGTLCGLIWAFSFDRHSFGHSLFRVVALALLLLPNFSPALSPLMFPLNLPGWSLFWELVVNLVFGVAARFRVAKDWVLLLATAISLLAILRWSAQGHVLGDLGWQSKSNLIGLDFARVVLSFSTGLLLYRLYRLDRLRIVSLRISYLVSVIIIVVFILLLRVPLTWMTTNEFQILTIALFFPLLVFAGAHCRLPHKLDGICALLGEISYPIYLLHTPFLRILDSRHGALFAANHPGMVVVVFPVAVAILVVFSFCAARFYETPVRRWLSGRKEARKLVAA